METIVRKFVDDIDELFWIIDIWCLSYLKMQVFAVNAIFISQVDQDINDTVWEDIIAW